MICFFTTVNDLVLLKSLYSSMNFSADVPPTILRVNISVEMRYIVAIDSCDGSQDTLRSTAQTILRVFFSAVATARYNGKYSFCSAGCSNLISMTTVRCARRTKRALDHVITITFTFVNIR